MTFSANAGDNDSLAFTNYSWNPSSAASDMNIYVTAPDGTTNVGYCSRSTSSCEIHMRNLPQTGTYNVQVATEGFAATSLTATLSADVTGSLVSGTPFPISMAATGQSATLAFTTSATQTITVAVSSINVTPNASLTIDVYGTSSSSIQRFFTYNASSMTLNNLPAGNYWAVVTQASPTTGSLQLTYH
jgi:hypothetical protein